MPSKSGSIMSSTTASGRWSLAVLTALLPVCATLDLPALVAQRHADQLGDVRPRRRRRARAAATRRGGSGWGRSSRAACHSASAGGCGDPRRRLCAPCEAGSQASRQPVHRPGTATQVVAGPWATRHIRRATGPAARPRRAGLVAAHPRRGGDHHRRAQRRRRSRPGGGQRRRLHRGPAAAAARAARTDDRPPQPAPADDRGARSAAADDRRGTAPTTAERRAAGSGVRGDLNSTPPLSSTRASRTLSSSVSAAVSSRNTRAPSSSRTWSPGCGASVAITCRAGESTASWLIRRPASARSGLLDDGLDDGAGVLGQGEHEVRLLRLIAGVRSAAHPAEPSAGDQPGRRVPGVSATRLPPLSRLSGVMSGAGPQQRRTPRRRPSRRRSGARRPTGAPPGPAEVERRSALVPQVSYPDELPVSQRREDIAAAIRDHQVVIVAGETGSGKTTQLPKICLELGRGRARHDRAHPAPPDRRAQRRRADRRGARHAAGRDRRLPGAVHRPLLARHAWSS